VLPRGSGVVLALDLVSLEESRRILRDLADLVDAVKLGWFQLLEHGPREVAGMIREFSEKYFLADLKIGDVDHVNQYITMKLMSMGFRGLIMHSIVGPENLRSSIRLAHDNGVEVYLLVSMSMGGELYDEHLDDNLRMGMGLGVDGFVVPATKPLIVRRTREVVGGGYVILSPGVGVQGAKPGCAIANGADFEIVGRSVISSPKPREALIKLIDSRGTTC